MELANSIQLIDLAKLTAKKQDVTVQDALLAFQLTLLATLTEVISAKEVQCGSCD